MAGHDPLKPYAKRIAKLKPAMKAEFMRCVRIHRDYVTRYGIEWNIALVEKWLWQAERGLLR